MALRAASFHGVTESCFESRTPSGLLSPGEQKCLAPGRSAFFVTERIYSQNLSLSFHPVSRMYDRVHARQVASRAREPLSYR